MNRTKLMDFNITLGSYHQFLDNILLMSKRKDSSNICVANVHMFIEAFKNKKLLQQINSSNIITPDGRPLVWSLRLLYGIRQDRVCGMDLVPDLFGRLMDEGLPVFFYGGSEELLETTCDYISECYPQLKIAGTYSPPFRELREKENEEIVQVINSSNAALVFVILGCPKQEKWMASMRGKINAAMIGIGGALAVTVGEMRRAPKWMQLYGLEWLFRFYQEPRRLLKRYTTTNFFFLYLIIKELVRIKILRSKS